MHWAPLVGSGCTVLWRKRHKRFETAAATFSMADSRTAETHRRKRDEIARSIDDYTARLEQARADLAHIDSAIAIFSSDDAKPARPYVDVHRLFKRGEPAAISREALKDGPRNTRELALAVMAAGASMQATRYWRRLWPTGSFTYCGYWRGAARIVGIGKHKAARIWRLTGSRV